MKFEIAFLFGMGYIVFVAAKYTIKDLLRNDSH